MPGKRDSSKTIRVTIGLPRWHRAMLDRVAKKHRVTRAAAARLALRAFIEVERAVRDGFTVGAWSTERIPGTGIPVRQIEFDMELVS